MNSDELFEGLQALISRGLVKAEWDDEHEDFVYSTTPKGLAHKNWDDEEYDIDE